MKAVIDALLEISLYSAIVTGALLLFRVLFRKRISPKLQYLAWGVLILRLMLPFTVESGFHVQSLFPATAQSPAIEIKAPPDWCAVGFLGLGLRHGPLCGLDGICKPALPPPHEGRARRNPRACARTI
ncbi:MAG: hypothetical protein AAGU74_00700 [Bacillota bacterium]